MSSTPTFDTTSTDVTDVRSAEESKWHGYLLAGAGLPLPTCVTQSADLARPTYTNIRSAEYEDTPEVLEVKAEMILQMWRAASHPLVYAGAGISTSSGIRDYASNAKGSAVQPAQKRLTHAFVLSLKPTPAHRVITEMERRGMVWGWLQQNHDGLAQKAGFPAHKVNELHGAWLDSKANPVIKMSGSLRGDLYAWMLEMEDKCDFVFGVGTSFSGLNADRCADSCATRHMSNRQGQGLAIVSIQQTPMDRKAAVRVFAKIDTFMLILAAKLQLPPISASAAVVAYAPAPLPVGPMEERAWLAERKSRYAAAEQEATVKVAATVVRQQRAQSTVRPAGGVTVVARSDAKQTVTRRTSSATRQP